LKFLNELAASNDRNFKFTALGGGGHCILGSQGPGNDNDMGGMSRKASPTE
jgi:hypothetical protein